MTIEDRVNICSMLADRRNMPRQRHQDPKLEQTKGKRPKWCFRANIDKVSEEGTVYRVPKRFYLGYVGEMPKRTAEMERRRILTEINRTDYILKTQIPFSDFVSLYVRDHLSHPEKFAASTRAKYENHLRNHILPAFGKLLLGQISTKHIDDWLNEKALAGLAHSTRTDLRNILSAIFSQATRWDYYEGRNPVERATVGRQRVAREKRFLTVDESRALLGELPEDVRDVVSVALFCNLRISEILGLQEKHLDFENRRILVRQRFHRGDLDTVKTFASKRDRPMGMLRKMLRRRTSGNPENFVFRVKTSKGFTRDDRSINRYFLRPAAKRLGLYYEGFGFHALRRAAITEQGNDANPFQLMRNAGHTRMDVSLLYTQADRQRDRTAVLRHQKRVFAASTKRVGAKPASAKPNCHNPSKLRILALPQIVVLGRKDRKAKEEEWWACADSNCRPLPCQGAAANKKRNKLHAH